jgi:hypothetical protein
MSQQMSQHPFLISEDSAHLAENGTFQTAYHSSPEFDLIFIHLHLIDAHLDFDPRGFRFGLWIPPGDLHSGVLLAREQDGSFDRPIIRSRHFRLLRRFA